MPPIVALSEQPGQQRHQGNADERHPAASHQLFDALAFCLCEIKK
jgi:hypothetical protein